MSKHKIWLHRLDHLIEAIEEILQFTRNITEEEFHENRLIVRAVERNFQIIGEASKHIPDDVKEKYQDVEWDKMKAMRNFVVHEYNNVQEDVIWITIQKHLPETLAKLKFVLEQEDE